MADKKITELASVTGDNLADDDVFVVVDISEDETKKVTREEFFIETPEITVGDGAIKLKGNALNGTQVTIADDAVAELTFSGRSGGFLFVGAQFDTAFPQTQFSYGGVVDFGDSPGRLTAFQQGANVEVNTVDTLTGTTGTDGDLTIGLAGTSGSLYLENRAGHSRTFQITLL